MDIKAILNSFLELVNEAVIPFLLLVAFLIFIWNVTHYFIIGGSNEDGQTKARSLAIWGISAFVILLSLWGVINIIVTTFNFDNRSIVPDYMCEKSDAADCRGEDAADPSLNDPDDQNGFGNWQDYEVDPGGSYGVQGGWGS